jgi:hypothetical protein
MNGKTKLEKKVLKHLADNDDWPHATQIWQGVGGRTGILGLFVGPSFTDVVSTLHRLDISGEIQERRESHPGEVPRRHYRLPKVRSGLDD